MKKTRVGFGAGVVASVALHVALAAILLFRLPPSPPEPEKEETVKVEMVPEPETPPEKEKPPEKEEPPEKKPEPSEEQQKQPVRKSEAVQPEMPPSDKPLGDKPLGEKSVVDQPADQRPAPAAGRLPQALASASKEGEKEPAAGPSSKIDLRQAGASKAEPVKPSEAEQQQPAADAKHADIAVAAKLPDLALPETETARDTIDEPQAIEKTAPESEPKAETVIPQPRPDAAAQAEIVRNAATGAGAQQSPADLKPAKQLYSANALSDPRVRQALGKLSRERRIVQICMVEALEQIRRDRPETLPQGLFFDPQKQGSPFSGNTLTATRGAYRSTQGWYDIDFQCTVTEAADGVAAFSYSMGGAVPRSDWQARNFPRD